MKKSFLKILIGVLCVTLLAGCGRSRGADDGTAAWGPDTKVERIDTISAGISKDAAESKTQADSVTAKGSFENEELQEADSDSEEETDESDSGKKSPDPISVEDRSDSQKREIKKVESQLEKSRESESQSEEEKKEESQNGSGQKEETQKKESQNAAGQSEGTQKKDVKDTDDQPEPPPGSEEEKELLNASEHTKEESLESQSENGSENESKEDQTALKPLKEILETEIGKETGIWSIYVKDLVSGCSLSIHNDRMVAASLIKLYVAGAYYDAIEKGLIDQSAGSYDETVAVMINRSDNGACNQLIDLLGMDRINQFIRENGFLDTELTRRMLENTGTENYTSVKDCGKLLEEIFNGEYVSPEASTLIISNMLAQERKGKIPAGVPSGYQTANKTGELASVENDVAIIWGDRTVYTLCVMTSGITSPGLAQKEIANISKMVFEYFDTHEIKAAELNETGSDSMDHSKTEDTEDQNSAAA